MTWRELVALVLFCAALGALHLALYAAQIAVDARPVPTATVPAIDEACLVSDRWGYLSKGC